MFYYARNTHPHQTDITAYSREMTGNVRRVHRMVPGYQYSEMRSLDSLAAALGVKAVLLKDESARFGLRAFKGLGGIYAMYRIICRELGLDGQTTELKDLQKEENLRRIREMTFATTTDGNHGKGVSWAAGFFGCRAVVNMPKGSAEARVEAIRRAGSAVVTVTDMTYDDCVAWTAGQAREKGWFLIQDTAWDGYEEIPGWIMQGYTTMLFEAAEQTELTPTHLFLQAGVGSMAAAVAAAARTLWKDIRIFTAEPEAAACFHDSFAAGDGQPRRAKGSGITQMAGLNCAVPCKTAWEILGGIADGAFSCSEDVTEKGIRYLHRMDPPVIAGESGAVTTGLLLELAENNITGLNRDSVILVFNTEGDTDPENYQRIIR